MERKRGKPKGLPKTGGRTKGTPNKCTQLGGEDNLKKLVDTMEEPTRMKAELATLHGRDFFRVYFEALSYLRPKLSSVELQGGVNINNEVADRIKELAGL